MPLPALGTMSSSSEVDFSASSVILRLRRMSSSNVGQPAASLSSKLDVVNSMVASQGKAAAEAAAAGRGKQQADKAAGRSGHDDAIADEIDFYRSILGRDKPISVPRNQVMAAGKGGTTNKDKGNNGKSNSRGKSNSSSKEGSGSGSDSDSGSSSSWSSWNSSGDDNSESDSAPRARSKLKQSGSHLDDPLRDSSRDDDSSRVGGSAPPQSFRGSLEDLVLSDMMASASELGRGDEHESALIDGLGDFSDYDDDDGDDDSISEDLSQSFIEKIYQSRLSSLPSGEIEREEEKGGGGGAKQLFSKSLTSPLRGKEEASETRPKRASFTRSIPSEGFKTKIKPGQRMKVYRRCKKPSTMNGRGDSKGAAEKFMF